MPYSSLADFLEHLEQNNTLLRVDEPIDPKELLCAVRFPGKSVLLSHVEGCRFPMAGPLMIDPGRVARAIGVADMEEAAVRVEEWKQEVDGWTKEVSQAGAQQVVRLASDLDGAVLPGWLSGVTLFTVDPDSGRRLGVAVELETDSPTRLVIRWSSEVGVGAIQARYAELGRPMPMAICAGGDPAIYLASAAPVPRHIDPCVLGAVLRGRPVEVVSCHTCDLLAVPADADLIIEGFLIGASAPGELCCLSTAQHVNKNQDDFVGATVEVLAVTHRINPVLPFAMPEERAVVRRTMLRAMVPWWRSAVPGLADLALPDWGGDASVLVGSVEKAYVKQAEQIAETLAEHPVWSSDRTVILVDRAVNLASESAVLAALLRNVDFGRRTLLAVERG